VRKLMVCAVGLVAALAFTVPGALGGAAATPGVTAKTITIGGTFPLTGPAASYAPIPLGMKAYFSYVNARRASKAQDPARRRGVFGRQLIWKYYDDAYNPANTVLLTRRLIEQDHVFATVGALGTEPQLAVRSYMNDQKAPQTLVSTGATEFSSQYKQYPWTIGWQPDYIAEGRIYGLHVKANFNGKKIAVIYQNDDYGKDYLYGFRAALGKTYSDENIVDQEAIESTATSAASQITRIKASGAQVFAVFQLPTPTVRSIATAKALGFNPTAIYMNSVANVKPAVDAMVGAAGAAYTNGIISIAYTKDPQDTRWANDPGMKLYRSIIAKYSGGANADDPQVLYGVAKADTFVQALYKAGKNPTRASLMSALTSLNITSQFLIPGMTMKTSARDHYVISQMQLQRLNSATKVFVPFGKLIEGRPR
jgi:branched-chain amino acid transport system substrate-binding protein